jgi:hypothetical protein
MSILHFYFNLPLKYILLSEMSIFLPKYLIQYGFKDNSDFLIHRAQIGWVDAHSIYFHLNYLNFTQMNTLDTSPLCFH